MTKLSCLVFIIFSVFSLPVNATGENNNEKIYTEIASAIDVYISNVNSLRPHLDNTRFNSEELLLQLDLDESRIIDYVSKAINFEQYSGLLRGVNGTIKSRAGNALDQSVLLASLLNSAGWETRIVSGHLNEQDALRLIGLIVPVAIENDLGQKNTLQPALDKFGLKAPGTTKQSQDQLLYDDTQKSKELILKALDRHGISLTPQKLDDVLVKEAQAYFWVEYRLTAGNKWLAVHPAFGQSKAMPVVEATAYFKDSVPEKYQQKLQIEAFIEQRIGSKTSVASVMKPWQRPVANLDGVALTYINVPDGLRLDNLADLEDVVKTTRLFSPVFNGAPAGGSLFDLKGRVVDRMAVESDSLGMSALFQTFSDKTDNALSALSNSKEKKSSFSLVSHWLEFTFTSPGGKERKFRRYIYGPYAEGMNENSIKLALMTEHTFMVNTGRQSLDYLSDRYLNHLVENNKQLKTLLHHFLLKDKKTVMPKGSLPQDIEGLAQYRLFNSMPGTDGWISYRAEPGLISFRNGYSDFDTPFFNVDVIANKRRLLEKKSDGIYSIPTRNITFGVWETATERVPASARGSRQRHLDTFKIIEAAKQQGIPLQLISNAKDLDRAKLSLDDRTRYFIQNDLDAGYLALVPSKKPQGLALNGWWRIHKTTGQTLGMASNGRGTELYEYAVSQLNNAMTLVNGLRNLKKCEGQGSMAQQLCCYMNANASNIGGMAYGNVMTAGMGAAGAALYTIVDFGLAETTGQGLAPPVEVLDCGGL